MESNNHVQNINQSRPWQARGPDLSIIYISRLAETHPYSLIFLPLKPAHGRVIRSSSVFHPDVGCRGRWAPGSCHSQHAELPNDSDSVWVSSLILKASWDQRHFTGVRKVVSEGELSAAVVDQSLSWRKGLVVIALLCTLSALNIYVQSNLSSAKCYQGGSRGEKENGRKYSPVQWSMQYINLKMVWGTSYSWEMYLNNAKHCQVFERWDA